MRTTQRLFLTALLAAMIFCGSATFNEAQRRMTKQRNAVSDSTGQSEADKFWQKYVPACNGARYIKKAASIFVELRGFRLTVNNDSLTEADRLNGIEAKGSSAYSATGHRTYARGKWGAWQNGLPEDSTLTNAVRFQKTNDKWRFYGVGYFNDYAKTFACSELPGAQASGGSQEIPTNAIQISDTHVFPIQNFWLWDGGTNKQGPRFPQSTTTYIYWKIMYQGTAFDYPKPQTESYWYKDGKEWSYAESAGFSNTGAGYLYHGKGWDQPGRWEPGNYTIKIYVRKKLVKIAEFEIAADGDAPQTLRFDGIYRLDGAAYDYVSAIRFYEDGTLSFGRESASNRPLADLERIASCLVKRRQIACGEIEVAQGTYTLLDKKIEFQIRFPGESSSYNGTVSSGGLELQLAQGASPIKTVERFVFSSVRLN